jgi:DtxR family Mn-dependent transcriptional regulator
MANGSSSESVEMYLKTLAELGGENAIVSIGRVAERLGISTVSASEMMKRLGDQGYIHHQPYKGVALTESGIKLASSVIRRQRLWECFLVDHLGMDWAGAYDLACDLEHATAPEVADALAEYLGQPATCPHGNPIPASQAGPGLDQLISLASLPVGQAGRIRAIVPENSEILAYLDERRIRPGQWVKPIEAAPLKGPLTLKLENGEISLGLAIAELVMVELENDSSDLETQTPGNGS